jgi:hypothetical protein
VPVTLYTEPLYTLTCDRCDYAADTEENEVTFFTSEYNARAWARDSGWSTSPRRESESVICPGCVSEDEDEEMQDAEITAAVRYAMDNT